MKRNALPTCSRASISPFFKIESGTFALETIFTVAGGMLFAMLFLNLARYVSAHNAVEQAARRAVRCLSTTDAGCRSEEVSAASEPQLDWYGERVSPVTLNYADRYNYTAELTKETWTANYSTYTNHYVTPTLGYSTFQVPLRTFAPATNPWETRQLSLRLTATKPTPSKFRAEFEQFPEWRESIERGFLGNEDPGDPAEQWHYYLLSAGSIEHVGHTKDLMFPPQYTIPFPVTIPITPGGGGRQSFETAKLEIPQLNASKNSVRLRSKGQPWNGLVIAHGGDNDDWWSNAHLVIKAEAYLQSRGGRVSWPSLYFKSWDKDGKLVMDRDLGGRSASPTINPRQRYNLWLRGPKGSHGGDTSRLHDNLVVPRGGRFIVGGYIQQTSNHSSAITGTITLTIGYDSYTELPQPPETATKDCNNVQLTKWIPNKDVVCANLPASCLFAGDWTISSCEAAGPYAATPSCSDPGDYGFPVAVDYGSPVTAATPSSDWKPNGGALPPAPAGKNYCAWAIVGSAGTVEVGHLAPGNNDLAQGIPHSVSCPEALFSPAQYYGEPLSCPAAASAVANSGPQAAQVNSIQPSGAPIFSALQSSDFRWTTPNADSWRFSWSAASADPAITQVHPHTKSVSRYQQVGETALSIKDFKIIGDDGTSAPASLPAQITETKTQEAITNGYPFQGPSFEIINPQAPEGACEKLAHPMSAPLDAALRYYAGLLNAEAKKPNVVLTTAATLADTPLVSDSGACGQAAKIFQPAAKSCIQRSLSAAEYNCGDSVYLGRFLQSAYPNGPEACANGSYSYCRSHLAPDTYTAPSYSSTVNEAPAKDIARKELIRAFGEDLKLDCTSAGCAALHVASGEEYARVGVDYQLPLSFPLDMLTGADHLTISSTSEEALESFRPEN